MNMLMKRKRLPVMVLLASFMLLLAGCGGWSDIQKDVTPGRSVFVDEDGTVYFAYDNIVGTAKKDGAKISGFSPLITVNGRVNALAVHGDDLYVESDNGFSGYPLSELSREDGAVSDKMILREDLGSSAGFEIFEDKIFYQRGDVLCCVPASGGESEELADGVLDYEVTSKGIFYAGADGQLSVVSPDLSEISSAGKIQKGVKFAPGGSDIYYGSDKLISRYSLRKRSATDTGNKEVPDSKCVPWVSGETILYADKRHDLHMISSSGEQSLGKLDPYPDKSEGVIYEDMLIANCTGERTMLAADFAEAKIYRYDLEKIMPQAASGTGQDEEKKGAAYDICRGQSLEEKEDGTAELRFNGFTLSMPGSKNWGWEQVDETSVTVFLTEARKSGYGGELITIMAFDMDDRSYENMPRWIEAGTSKELNKVFVAVYPTGVQWDPEDEGQGEEYKELQDHLLKIGTGEDGDPFRTGK